jgi:hypothetical protein
LCSIWMFTRDVCCKEVILMLKVVLLLHLCVWRMKNLSHMTNLSIWMKNGWNDNWVTNLNVSHITKSQFICADISLQHEAKETRNNTNRVTNLWHTHCNSL